MHALQNSEEESKAKENCTAGSLICSLPVGYLTLKIQQEQKYHQPKHIQSPRSPPNPRDTNQIHIHTQHFKALFQLVSLSNPFFFPHLNAMVHYRLIVCLRNKKQRCSVVVTFLHISVHFINIIVNFWKLFAIHNYLLAARFAWNFSFLSFFPSLFFFLSFFLCGISL